MLGINFVGFYTILFCNKKKSAWEVKNKAVKQDGKIPHRAYWYSLWSNYSLQQSDQKEGSPGKACLFIERLFSRISTHKVELPILCELAFNLKLHSQDSFCSGLLRCSVWKNLSYKSSSGYWFFQERNLWSKDLWKFHLSVVTRISPMIINTVNNYAKLKQKL